MKEYSKTLYKKDSKGKIRILTIETKDGTIFQTSGLLEGKRTIRESHCKPKNVGKANETSKQEQALLEAESKVTLKLREGYFETVLEAESEEVIMPMLAKVFEEEMHKVIYPCYIQPKLDGMRALAIVKNGKVKLMSRTNKEITTMQHIVADLEKRELPDVILDGELYAHGITFQENMRLLKKYRKGESEAIKYHVYDMISDKPFSERLYDYINLDASIVEDSVAVDFVSTFIAIDIEELNLECNSFISEGFEGAMVRWGEDGYKVNGRSDSLLKMKKFLDATYKIVDVVASEKSPSQGVLVCLDEKLNVTFNTGMKFSHVEREEILKSKDKYIGKTAEIRFFEFTDAGLPRFPVCVGFRLDK